MTTGFRGTRTIFHDMGQTWRPGPQDETRKILLRRTRAKFHFPWPFEIVSYFHVFCDILWFFVRYFDISWYIVSLDSKYFKIFQDSVCIPLPEIGYSLAISMVPTLDLSAAAPGGYELSTSHQRLHRSQAKSKPWGRQDLTEKTGGQEVRCFVNPIPASSFWYRVLWPIPTVSCDGILQCHFLESWAPEIAWNCCICLCFCWLEHYFLKQTC